MKALTTEEFNQLIGVDDSYKAPDKLMQVLLDREAREEMFRRFLHAFSGDVTFDWFVTYFQDEHADRKKKKQDFTPRSVADLANRLVGDTSKGDGSYYETAVGTGSITISRWNHDRIQHSPFDYRPSWYFYVLEELSERAIPFLLFNCMIRGMNAVILHGDALTRETYHVYFVQNDKDDHMTFSSLNILPRSEAVANSNIVYGLKWKADVEDKTHIESPEWQDLGVAKYPSTKGSIGDHTRVLHAMLGGPDIGK